MKVLVTNYTFSAAAKTITFGDYASITLESVLLVTNVTDGIIIYNFADPTKGGTVATNVLTLEYDTTTMADADDLQIYYDDTAASQSVGGNVASGTTDSGNPVKVGGKYNATLPTLTDGHRGDMQLGQRGSIRMTPMVDNSTTAIAVAAANADGVAAASVASRLETISRGSVFNGTTWDRQRGDTSGTHISKVIPGTAATELGKAEDAAHTTGDVGVMALAVRSDSEAALAGTTGDYIPLMTDSTGKLRTSAAGTVAHDAVDAGAPVKIGGKASSSAPADVAAADRVDAYFDLKGRLKVDASDVAIPVTTIVPGTAATNLGKAEDAAHASGDTGVFALGVRNDDPTISSGTDGDYSAMGISNIGSQWVTQTPTNRGGALVYKTLDLDETEEEIAATRVNLYGYYIFNAASSVRYIKFYNATAANVTVGTTTPTMTIPLAAGAGANVEFSVGVQFGTALCIAATTGLADNDTGAPGANEVIANIIYKS